MISPVMAPVVVIQLDGKEIGAHPRCLAGSFSGPRIGDIHDGSQSLGSQPEQAEPGDAERHGDGKLAPRPEEGRPRQRDDAARVRPTLDQVLRIGLGERLHEP